jgi:hypothetical protein
VSNLAVLGGHEGLKTIARTRYFSLSFTEVDFEIFCSNRGNFSSFSWHIAIFFCFIQKKGALIPWRAAKTARA